MIEIALNVGSVVLRRLQSEDAPALMAFYNGLSVASKRTFRPIDVTTTVAVCAAIAEANREACPTKFDLIAVNGGTTSGGIVGWSFLWNLESDEPVFGLAVADAYQGRGLGTALITHVMTWARAEQMPSVFLTVVQDNDVAHHLYEKQGFVKYGEFIGEDGLPYDRMRADLG